MGGIAYLATSANVGNILAIVDTKLRQWGDRAEHEQVADSVADWTRRISGRMDWIRLRASAALGRDAGRGSGGRSSTGLRRTRPGGHLLGHGHAAHTYKACARHMVGQREVVLARRDRGWHRMGNFPGVRLVVRNVPARLYLREMLMPKRETVSIEEATISNMRDFAAMIRANTWLPRLLITIGP